MTLLDVVEKTIPPAKMPKPLKEQLAAARAKMEEVKSTLGDAKTASEETTNLVVKAKKSLPSGDEDKAPAPAPAPEPNAGVPHDTKGM